MREAEIQGVSPRKGKRTTVRAKEARPAPDLEDRDLTATGPNQIWVADITYVTYVPTWSGFLFLAIVLDVWSRRVVGWAMATHLRTELVLEALDMALERRKPRGVIHHSDQGCQYTSLAFGRRCELNSRGSAHGGVPLHRRVVQFSSASLFPRLPVAGDVRSQELAGGGGRARGSDLPSGLSTGTPGWAGLYSAASTGSS